jgi:hypothetical protein
MGNKKGSRMSNDDFDIEGINGKEELKFKDKLRSKRPCIGYTHYGILVLDLPVDIFVWEHGKVIITKLAQGHYCLY